MAGPFINTIARRLQTLTSHIASAQTLSKSSLCQYTSARPCICAEPRVALYDEEVKITLRNFPPNEKITLHGQVTQLSSKIVFASCGHFVSSSSGELDLCRDVSHGGTYTGVEPMGILWSLQAAPGQPRDVRMAINFTDRPCEVTLQAFMGHLDLEEIHSKGDLNQVADIKLERSFRGAGVTRTEIEAGNIRGALYLPPGEGPFPAVIDMFGSSGGLIEYRSALLASRGFATLSLAYFKYKDLPDSLYDLKYEYFEEAINWLASHSQVRRGGIGVIAVSKGVENALFMGAYSDKVSAVIAINGFCYPTAGSYLRHNKLIGKGGDIDTEQIQMTDEGMDLRKLYATYNDCDVIPFWEGRSKYLFFESLDDFQKPLHANDKVLSNLCPEDKKKNIQVVKYEGAGHLLEPPYNALCRSSVNKGFGIKMKWGGQPRQHAYAQVDAWKRTLNFFRQNISPS